MASAAINWALFMPKSWDHTTTTEVDTVAEIQQRRARCKIPDDVGHREKWRLALDMLDQITGPPGGGAAAGGSPPEVDNTAGWGLPQQPVVADAGYGDITGFRLGLEQRGLHYAVAVKGTTSAYPIDATPSTPTYSGRGRPPTPRYRDDPTNLTGLAVAAGRQALHRLTWRQGSRKKASNRRPRCAHGSWPCGYDQPIAKSPATPTAAFPSAG